MMSGLRSQREYTMTCVSLRSGIASSGPPFIEYPPATTATATSTKTMNRFLAENSMMALITGVPFVLRRLGRRSLGSGSRLRFRRPHPFSRRLQLALRIDQERAGRHDALARCQAALDRHSIAEALAR